MPSRPEASRRPAIPIADPLDGRRSRGRQSAPPCSLEEADQRRLTSAATKAIAARTRLRPRLAIWLGSGFGGLAEGIEVEARIPYAAIPGFTRPTVPGHAGELVFGRLDSIPLCLLAGRAHYYEGHELAVVTFPVRVLARMGVRDLVLTNAAGGIRADLEPGDFLLITDHINAMGVNPLRGWTDGGSDGFVDLSALYDAGLSRLLRRAARQEKLPLPRGVYLAVSGPSYETPAEIRAFAGWGADAVGMSTVPEAMVARHCGLRVAGLSCITNAAAGRTQQPVSHAEVLALGHRNAGRARRLLVGFVRLYARTGSSRVLP